MAQCPSPEVFCRIHSITKLAPVPWGSPHYLLSLYHHNMYICGCDGAPHKGKSKEKKPARFPSQPPHAAASSLPRSTIAKGFPWEITLQERQTISQIFPHPSAKSKSIFWNNLGASELGQQDAQLAHLAAWQRHGNCQLGSWQSHCTHKLLSVLTPCQAHCSADTPEGAQSHFPLRQWPS